MRVKETGNDYRYFPEPDIPILELTDEDIKNAKDDLPILPTERLNKYISSGISEINAKKIIANKDISDYLLDFNGNMVIASNLFLGDISAYLNKKSIKIFDTKLSIDRFSLVVDMLDKKELSNKQVKDMLEELLESNDDINSIIDKYKSLEMSEEDIEKIILNILEVNKDKVEEYRSGNDRLSKFFIGQVMKETKGAANPIIANKILNRELNK